MSDEMNEFYDDATAAFPSVDDLCPNANDKAEVSGRLVAIWAKSNGVAQGDNGPYGYTETITLVLDDGPDGDQATELVGEAPVRLDLRHSTTGIHSRLKPRVDGRTKDGIPLAWRPMIGRVNSRPSTKYKKGAAAMSIAEPTPEDRAVIMAHKDRIIVINKELEAAASAAEDQAAFG